MIKPDIIAVQPTHIDFPLFRYQVRKYRSLFNNVIIVFSDHHRGASLTSFFRKVMAPDNVIFTSSSSGDNGDWRNAAIHTGLNVSTGSHVLFFEQDFVIKNNRLLPIVLSKSDQIVGFQEDVGSRLHPAFLLIDKEKLHSTSMNFSADPAIGLDHFDRIYLDVIERRYQITTLEQLNLHSPSDWMHVRGATYLYQQYMDDCKDVQGMQPQFLEYNRLSLSANVRQHPDFINTLKRAAAQP